jgi:hypothetical protein
MSFFSKVSDFFTQQFPDLDNPPPIVYNKAAPIVWARLEEAIRTVPTTQDDVDARTGWNNPTPLSNEPYFEQVTFTFRHADLYELKFLVPPEQQDLKSQLILNAYIKPNGNKSELTLRWVSKPIFSRQRHNEFIKLMTTSIDSLIKKGTQIPT